MSAEARIVRLESQLDPGGIVLRLTFGMTCPSCGANVIQDGKKVFDSPANADAGGTRIRVALASERDTRVEHRCPAAQLVAVKP